MEEPDCLVDFFDSLIKNESCPGYQTMIIQTGLKNITDYKETMEQYYSNTKWMFSAKTEWKVNNNRSTRFCLDPNYKLNSWATLDFIFKLKQKNFYCEIFDKELEYSPWFEEFYKLIEIQIEKL
jgi:hypothetical protein